MKLLTQLDLNHDGWTPPVSWFVSRVYWREVGLRLPGHPEILEESKQYIQSLLDSGKFSCSRRYIERWQEILQQGMGSVIQVLTSPDDGEDQVLRSCYPIPLSTLISDDEMVEITDQVKHEVKLIRVR